MNALEKSLLEANQRRYTNASNPLKSHGPDHHWRVYQWALALAQRFGKPYDPDVLAAASLLHDMAAYYPDKTGNDYHDFDHKIALEVLREINFPNSKLSSAIDAIANHGSDPIYKKSDEPIEVTLLRDADKLDVFGPIGVARIIMVRTLKGDTLEDIVTDFVTNGHLQRKWESISLPETRELAQDDYSYSRDFFERLAKTLASSNL